MKSTSAQQADVTSLGGSGVESSEAHGAANLEKAEDVCECIDHTALL